MEKHICSYGCGREAKHQFKNEKWCCEETLNKCPAFREKNSKSNKGKKPQGAFTKGFKRKKKKCPICKKEFSTSNYEKHYQFCLKNQQKQMCVICGKEYISPYRRRKTCSDECQGILKKKPNPKVGKILKAKYANGELLPYGGGMKWYSFNKNGQEIKVQGSYELRACKILESWRLEKKIKDWEYTNDRVEYIAEDGENHTYFLDFKVFQNDGSFYYIETKGFEKERDQYKWSATLQQGFELEVWFNKDIQMRE